MPKVRLDVVVEHTVPLTSEGLRPAAAAALQVAPETLGEVRLVRKALDARRRMRRPLWRLSVEVDAPPAMRPTPAASCREPKPEPPRFVSRRARPDAPPVIVVGAGPAGLFAAWHLAESGARVALVERGKPVHLRARDFGRFRGKAELDPESNLCFGEGGAGTYSDGKLTTRIKDPLVYEVFRRLVSVGAPERILVDAKPHIGTNLLYRLLIRLREELERLGVTLHYQTRFERLALAEGRVRGVSLSNGTLDAPHVLLATGHSARDTFAALHAQAVPMMAKPFAVGVRIEHPQALIDQAQYRGGIPRPETLPPADYRLSHTVDTRGVYSFCMCPGGMIVPIATEPEMVVVNGMSTARRSSRFANSGLVVQVHASDFDTRDPLAGIELQRTLERKAFEDGGRNYFAPAMTAQDLLRGRASGKLAASHFRPGLTACDLRETLPPWIWKPLRAGLTEFGKTLPGYASEEANLIAIESRTSSPVRIPRDENFEVPGFPGLYVAGEGPGYAGGIASAAVDGLRAASAILARL